MSYVTQIQKLDKEAAQQVLFDALNVRAMAALSDMKNEATTNSKKLKEDTEQLDESVTVHVKAYGSKPDKKDTDHVKSGVELHNGTYDGHSDKGSYFKFKDEESAKKFKSHVDKSPNKTTYADILDESTQLDEARKVGEYTKDNHSATIHKEDDEYRVKFHKDGKHLPDADYFTDDKEDAEGTAKHQVNAMHNSCQVTEGIRDGNYYHMTHINDGNMPWGTDKLPKDTSKHAYVKYQNNEPVEVKLHKGQDRVWNYKTSDMMSIGKPIKSWDGKRDLPAYKGKIVGSGE